MDNLPVHENVVTIPISKIKIKGDRYRREFRNIESLAESIKENGQIQPIIVSDNYTLIAGERRYKAHQLLKLENINAIIRTHNEIENKIVEALENIEREDFTWDEEVRTKKDLHKNLAAANSNWSERKTAEKIGLANSGFITDLNLAEVLEEDPEIFKDCKNKTAALKRLKEYQIDEAMAEIKLRQTKTNYGKSAQNYIFKGNCLNLLDSLPEGIINAVISDPVYGIDINNTKKVDDDIEANIYEDDRVGYYNLLQQVITKLPRVMNPNSVVCIFGYIDNFQWLYDQLTANGFKCDPFPGIWYRGGGQTRQPNYNMARSYEIFVYGFRGEAQLIRPGLSNVLQYNGVPSMNKQHAVQKPLALMEELISRFCLPGHTILDFMAGSFTTGVAAIKKGCKPIGFELLEKNYLTAINRIAETLNAKDAGKLDLVSDVLGE